MKSGRDGLGVVLERVEEGGPAGPGCCRGVGLRFVWAGLYCDVCRVDCRCLVLSLFQGGKTGSLLVLFAYRTLHFALGVALLENVALVEVLLALGQGDFAFDQMLFPVQG